MYNEKKGSPEFGTPLFSLRSLQMPHPHACKPCRDTSLFCKRTEKDYFRSEQIGHFTMHPAYTYIKERLQPLFHEAESVAMAKHILTEVFGLSTLALYTGENTDLDTADYEKLDTIVARLQAEEPLQYILGYTYFGGRKFAVTPAVLIPRPETAELVEWIAQEHTGTAPRLLDIGTGSGCIAVSLAILLPEADITAWDISPEALAIARQNARTNHANVRFAEVDILRYEVAQPSTYEVIVSNPPYITESEKADMEAHVLNWEPHSALFAPPQDALAFYRRIAETGMQLLTPGGALYFEINRQFASEVTNVLRTSGYEKICLRQDMSGHDRMIKAIRP